MFFPWFLCGVLLLIVILLMIKILLLKRSMKELCEELKEHLAVETNTLLSTSSRDRQILHMTVELNRQLHLLRKQRQQFLIGSRELKDAVMNISHDLRTPLTAICGYLDLLEHTEKSETVCRYLETIQNRTEILKQLTEELFRYSVLSFREDTPTEPVTVNRILEDSIAGFYALLQERKIVPHIHIAEKKVVRQLNPAALSRVFSNLLNNAIKYSDGDLEITLTEAGEIQFSNTASELNAVQVGKLFDRFYTVEAAEKSTGLGLAISRSLVGSMNGSMTAEFTQGKLRIQVLFAE